METLTQILPWIQLVLSIALIALILLQQNEASLGGAFGGSDTAGHLHKRRGIEKLIFNATIIVAILFFSASIIALFT
ncbi:MAG: preprotein translocase subunit SecG [Candidatus Vogelbacteria bacterium RIFOXYD1_FULL_46_19]|uniref:Protein-export membrane protein SecG n=1 Tax=Candidatus Vogelbacteria bacterium RIFOXYD1_FULL_46_19 TaxID=1802439 RepID=A0A1G2QHC3_9BACT|nr:MAG: preprotein translocase subunit SecG [Candidatus Vogelbacteria bacterium RIFOXYD1_FULL_46_19]